MVSRSSRSGLPQAIILHPTDAGLAVARSLHARGVHVSLLTDQAWLSKSRWAEGHLLGTVGAHPDAWVGQLVEIARRGDGILISGSDRATELLTRERSRIPSGLRSFESPDSAHLELMDKASLYALAANADVRIPWTLRVGSHEDLDQVGAEAAYPCLLKASLSHEWRALFGSRRVLRIGGQQQLREAAAGALDAGLELLVTEQIPGPDRNLEGAVTIRRADGSYALAYGRRKLRMYPPGFGAGSLNESAAAPETMTLTKRLLDASAFVGVSAVEMKRHAETGELVLMEANVRIPQNWAIGDACGADATWRLYATLAGIPLPPQPPPVSGVKVLVPSLEPKAVVGGFMERTLSPRELLASYRGVRDLSGVSWRDPGPIAGLVARELRRLLRIVSPRMGKPSIGSRGG